MRELECLGILFRRHPRPHDEIGRRRPSSTRSIPRATPIVRERRGDRPPALRWQGNPARTIQLDRPLDFAAVTDHSEGFGTQSVCFLPGLPGYDSLACQQLRQVSSRGPRLGAAGLSAAPFPGRAGRSRTLPSSVCGHRRRPTVTSRQSLFWLEDQDAAEESYDRRRRARSRRSSPTSGRGRPATRTSTATSSSGMPSCRRFR